MRPSRMERGSMGGGGSVGGLLRGVVAAGTWGKAGKDGGCCSIKEEDLPKLPEISSELRVTQP